MEKWTAAGYEAFRKELWAMQDVGYRDFQARLLCTDLPVIGVRVPQLKRVAAQIAKADGAGFLAHCGRETYEERLLYGLVTAALPVGYAAFLPHCDRYAAEIAENWAHCDVFCSAAGRRIRGQEAAFYAHIEDYLRAENPWTVRIGLVFLLGCYLTPPYLAETLRRADGVQSEFYYIRMAQAWLLATAWAKDRESCMAYLPHCRLDDWTFRKFVQKARESLRVSAADKAYLRGLLETGVRG